MVPLHLHHGTTFAQPKEKRVVYIIALLQLHDFTIMTKGPGSTLRIVVVHLWLSRANNQCQLLPKTGGRTPMILDGGANPPIYGHPPYGVIGWSLEKQKHTEGTSTYRL